MSGLVHNLPHRRATGKPETNTLVKVEIRMKVLPFSPLPCVVDSETLELC